MSTAYFNVFQCSSCGHYGTDRSNIDRHVKRCQGATMMLRRLRVPNWTEFEISESNIRADVSGRAALLDDVVIPAGTQAETEMVCERMRGDALYHALVGKGDAPCFISAFARLFAAIKLGPDVPPELRNMAYRSKYVYFKYHDTATNACTVRKTSEVVLASKDVLPWLVRVMHQLIHRAKKEAATHARRYALNRLSDELFSNKYCDFTESIESAVRTYNSDRAAFHKLDQKLKQRYYSEQRALVDVMAQLPRFES